MRRLNLEMWMENYADFKQGVQLNKFLMRMEERQAFHMDKDHGRLPLLELLHLPDGHYHERLNSTSFFVRNGVAYKGIDKEGFEYSLDILTAQQKIGNIEKTRALAKLEREVLGENSTAVRELLHGIYWLEYGRDIRKGGAMMRKRLKAKVAKLREASNND